MSDQLSQSDWNEFDSALKDIRDTFFKMDIKLKRYTENYSNYYAREKSEITDLQIIELKALTVFDKDSNALNERKAFGQYDLSEGYLLLYYHDLVDAGLVDLATKKHTIDTTVDEVEFQNTKYILIGDAQVGPFQDRFATVKLFFKKVIDNG